MRSLLRHRDILLGILRDINLFLTGYYIHYLMFKSDYIIMQLLSRFFAIVGFFSVIFFMLRFVKKHIKTIRGR